MIETMIMILALIAGALLSLMFFGGLWWTVQKGLPHQWAGLWFFSSLLARTSIVMTGFYFIAQGHLERLVACLIGFVITRYIVMRLTRVAIKPKYLLQEASHAPQS